MLLSLINTVESGYEGYYYLGLIKSEQNMFKEAIKYLNKAAKINANMPRIYYNLGLLYQKTGKKTKAEKALKETLKISPDTWIICTP
ncbi:MAG: tetratricopeptide repeat protein [Bacteroidota bacterium]